MSFNFVSAVGIVFCNKYVFHHYHFDYATLMTALHFFATWLGVLANLRLKQYTIKELKNSDVFPITLSFCSFVVFNNMSLQHNSVGFYQLMKVLTTPVVVVLQSLMYGVHMSWKLKLALVPVCVGVAMATVNDFSFNAAGTFWASAGLMATAFYQLLVKTRQDKLGVNSFQLLHYQAPQSAALVLLCTPIFDQMVGPHGVLNYQPTVGAMFAITFSCALAYCVNLSTYLVIGHTNPVSYQVLGHFKLLVILAAGILIFEEDANGLRLSGMLLAFVGVVTYTTLKQGTNSGWEKSTSVVKNVSDTGGSSEGTEGSSELLPLVIPGG